MTVTVVRHWSLSETTMSNNEGDDEDAHLGGTGLGGLCNEREEEADEWEAEEE